MVPQTISSCSPISQTTNCLFFDHIRHFVLSKWTETESRAVHMTFLVENQKNALLFTFKSHPIILSFNFILFIYFLYFSSSYRQR
jgi:hypothetical protein